MHSTATLATEITPKTAIKTHSIWGTAIRFTLVTAVLLGVAYPLAVTGIASLIFPHKAAGSLILKD